MKGTVTSMKIKDGFVTRKIGDIHYAVSFDPDSVIGSGMLKLSDSAYYIWTRLENGCSEEELLLDMKEHFDADEEVLKRDIASFISKLSELKIIE